MFTHRKAQDWLDDMQKGYRARQRLKDRYAKHEAVKSYVADKCRELNVRYSHTIRENALDAALSQLSKEPNTVSLAVLNDRFRDYFDEQLLIYAYRKLPRTEPDPIKNNLGKVLAINGRDMRGRLLRQFSRIAEADIDDIVYEAITVTYERLEDPEVRITSNIYAYQYSIAGHLCHKKLEKLAQQERLQQGIGFDTGSSPSTSLAYEALGQGVASAVEQYLEQRSSADCRSFLELYWRLKNPFDFTDPLTNRPIRESLVQERLGLSDEQLAALKARTIRLSQAEALQLTSGRHPSKQRAQEQFQTCVVGLLHYVTDKTASLLPVRHKTASTKSDKEAVNQFQKFVLKWMKTRPTTRTTSS